MAVEKEAAGLPTEILRRVYGHEDFRGQQKAVIDAVLRGENAFVLMPTGGGKSLCYQIPAMVRDGVGIVISPLIALMLDQVKALQELGVRAEYLNSSQAPAEASRVRAKLYAGELDLVYVSPERLLSEGFLESLEHVPLSLFAIDEAHCVSQWGHDFRPEYQQLSIVEESFPAVPRIALTATADEPTRVDIRRALKIEDSQTFVAGFDRPNIHYSVVLKTNLKRQLISFIRGEHERDSGIVYCRSRKKVESVAEWLREEGFNAFPYHAGMSAHERAKNQDTFIFEEQVIIVATIAFGMGIDKPNVRYVAHIDLPKSIEAYYQETGRAGRDGLPSTAWMAYGLSDVAAMRQMITRSDAPDDRRRIEHQKLTALLAYAETIECRRRALLRYFGEEYHTPDARCNACDTCVSPPETWNATEAAQQALSVVYRTGQRFGAGHLIDVLIGNDNERVQSLRHNQLPTFGVGKTLAAREWQAVFRQLIIGGFLDLTSDGFGGFRLTANARELLRGNTEVYFRIDPTPQKKRGRSSRSRMSENSSQQDVALFDLLRNKRLALARSRNIAPYMVFHDSTLQELASRRPGTPEEMAQISGVGEVKLERYGEDFLAVIKEFTQPPNGSQTLEKKGDHHPG